MGVGGGGHIKAKDICQTRRVYSEVGADECVGGGRLLCQTKKQKAQARLDDLREDDNATDQGIAEAEAEVNATRCASGRPVGAAASWRRKERRSV